ncbi:MAG TPA: response regulator, partial [Solirubrobacteraceae bacterium]|nr:response regulator [Solirubrobacteraceae bacterium]
MDVTPATILLVEDHRATRTFLADNLTVDGYELLEADNAADGERMLATRFPDLAIVDLGLPDRDGLDLIRRVRTADRA